MSEKIRFSDIKEEFSYENQRDLGVETREKYGDFPLLAANARVKNMTLGEYAQSDMLRKKADEALRTAFRDGDPAGSLARKAVEMHKEWLCFSYDSYSKDYHRGLGEMYVSDKRCAAYYNHKIAPGCVRFLRDAIDVYCSM